MVTRRQIIDRVRKLFALARSKNAAEADAARRQAVELMDEHGVTVLPDDDVRVRVTVEGVRVQDWQTVLLLVASRVHGCKVIAVNKESVGLSGAAGDVREAKVMYQRLYHEMLLAVIAVRPRDMWFTTGNTQWWNDDVKFWWRTCLLTAATALLARALPPKRPPVPTYSGRPTFVDDSLRAIEEWKEVAEKQTQFTIDRAVTAGERVADRLAFKPRGLLASASSFLPPLQVAQLVEALKREATVLRPRQKLLLAFVPSRFALLEVD